MSKVKSKLDCPTVLLSLCLPLYFTCQDEAFTVQVLGNLFCPVKKSQSCQAYCLGTARDVRTYPRLLSDFFHCTVHWQNICKIDLAPVSSPTPCEQQVRDYFSFVCLKTPIPPSPSPQARAQTRTHVSARAQAVSFCKMRFGWQWLMVLSPRIGDAPSKLYLESFTLCFPSTYIYWQCSPPAVGTADTADHHEPKYW